MSGDRPGLQALTVGASARIAHVFTAAQIDDWWQLAGTAGARAPAHNSVPEPLIAGLFSCLLGERLPGHGTNYLKQRMVFERPAPAGTALTASVTITHIRHDKALVDLDTVCHDAAGRIVCRGRALVRFDR
ncbi:hypothetical protein [Salinisphaera orenii]|uniref:hypothetical protein n=1 Tax=Salinisphaera orenii TaxID=856731 RepID=UPI000F4844B5|nr:hypothetical protein [Salinisphaera halophila]